MKFNFKLLILFAISAIIVFSMDSCTKTNSFITDTDAILDFSEDTILFDTVFTSLGSSRKELKVYNPHNEKILISNIHLAGGDASPYRLNIDGEAVLKTEDVEIYPKDSLFIQIMVTINPDENNNPFIVTDSIIFLTNGTQQDVDLVSYGQNANFYGNALLQGNHIWTADRPHIIYGLLIVDDSLNSSLTIEAGAEVYMHEGAIIAVDEGATLTINGTIDDPVKIQGDRLEDFYEDVAGQWGMIWLAPGSINNVINNAVIRNGIIGVRADTLGNSTEPTLLMNNTIIENMSAYGLLGQGTNMKVSNSVISNCGQFEVVLQYGGDYDFRHCTLGNYWGSGSGTGSLVLNNYYLYEYDTIARDLHNAYFGNCIVYGNNPEEELILSKSSLADYNYSFENCIIKTERKMDEIDQFLACFNEDPIFHNPEVGDYRLDTITSPAIDKGNLDIINNFPYFDLTNDLINFSRTSDGLPDLGAYEFQEIIEEEDE